MDLQSWSTGCSLRIVLMFPGTVLQRSILHPIAWLFLFKSFVRSILFSNLICWWLGIDTFSRSLHILLDILYIPLVRLVNVPMDLGLRIHGWVLYTCTCIYWNILELSSSSSCKVKLNNRTINEAQWNHTFHTWRQNTCSYLLVGQTKSQWAHHVR